MTTDLSVEDLQKQLWDIYELYSKAVVQNPNWQVDDCIEIPAFTSGVDSILLLSVCFSQLNESISSCPSSIVQTNRAFI